MSRDIKNYQQPQCDILMLYKRLIVKKLQNRIEGSTEVSVPS